MANDNFLPDNFEVKNGSGNYMKLQPGANRFRILSKPLLGYVWWVNDNGKDHPKRVPLDQTVPVVEIEREGDPKQFMTFAVWNYQDERVQILELTQKGLQRTIGSLSRDADWGDPREYDLVIDRVGEKQQTQYSLQPKPRKALDKAIEEKWKGTMVRLEALYEGADPFATSEDLNVDDVNF